MSFKCFDITYLCNILHAFNDYKLHDVEPGSEITPSNKLDQLISG